jgi:hypothetical protein
MARVQGVILGSSIGGAAILLILIAYLLYRKRRRRLEPDLTGSEANTAETTITPFNQLSAEKPPARVPYTPGTSPKHNIAGSESASPNTSSDTPAPPSDTIMEEMRRLRQRVVDLELTQANSSSAHEGGWQPRDLYRGSNLGSTFSDAPPVYEA